MWPPGATGAMTRRGGWRHNAQGAGARCSTLQIAVLKAASRWPYKSRLDATHRQSLHRKFSINMRSAPAVIRPVYRIVVPSGDTARSPDSCPRSRHRAQCLPPLPDSTDGSVRRGLSHTPRSRRCHLPHRNRPRRGRATARGLPSAAS